jgi:hypothetical protein
VWSNSGQGSEREQFFFEDVAGLTRNKEMESKMRPGADRRNEIGNTIVILGSAFVKSIQDEVRAAKYR